MIKKQSSILAKAVKSDKPPRRRRARLITALDVMEPHELAALGWDYIDARGFEVDPATGIVRRQP